MSIQSLARTFIPTAANFSSKPAQLDFFHRATQIFNDALHDHVPFHAYDQIDYANASFKNSYVHRLPTLPVAELQNIQEDYLALNPPAELCDLVTLAITSVSSTSIGLVSTKSVKPDVAFTFTFPDGTSRGITIEEAAKLKTISFFNALLYGGFAESIKKQSFIHEDSSVFNLLLNSFLCSNCLFGPENAYAAFVLSQKYGVAVDELTHCINHLDSTNLDDDDKISLMNLLDFSEEIQLQVLKVLPSFIIGLERRSTTKLDMQLLKKIMRSTFNITDQRKIQSTLDAIQSIINTKFSFKPKTLPTPGKVLTLPNTTSRADTTCSAEIKPVDLSLLIPNELSELNLKLYSGFYNLKTLTSLKQLTISDENFSDLQSIPDSVTDLTLKVSRDAQLVHLLHLEKLTNLSISKKDGDILDLTSLSRLKSLRTLELDGFENEFIFPIFQEINWLIYRNDSIKNLDFLSRFPQLEELNVRGWRSFYDISPISQLTNLKILFLSGTFNHLELSNLKSLESFYLVGEYKALTLRDLNSLLTLHLYWGGHVSITLSRLNQLLVFYTYEYKGSIQLVEMKKTFHIKIVPHPLSLS